MDTHYRLTHRMNTAPLKGEVSVLFCGKGEPVSGHFIGPAVHDYYLIHIVTGGDGVFETLGEKHHCRAGDVFVIFPDLLVKYEASEVTPWSYVWVGFSGAIVEKALEAIGITPERSVIRNCELERLEPIFDSMFSSLEMTEHPAAANMEASGWLRLLLAKLALHIQGNGILSSAPKSFSYRQIDHVIRLLSLQYSQPLSIGAIAESLGYHRAHLSKLFKETTGLSPKQYLHKVRMKKAEELLEGELTIAQIAASTGYNDPLFFTKQFHKWSGMSPTDYRREKQSGKGEDRVQGDSGV